MLKTQKMPDICKKCKKMKKMKKKSKYAKICRKYAALTSTCKNIPTAIKYAEESRGPNQYAAHLTCEIYKYVQKICKICSLCKPSSCHQYAKHATWLEVTVASYEC